MDVWGRYAPDMTQNGHKLVRFCDVHVFADVWGRYAPDMTQNGHKLVRFCDVHGCSRMFGVATLQI
jgi:hypothetical protein